MTEQINEVYEEVYTEKRTLKGKILNGLNKGKEFVKANPYLCAGFAAGLIGGVIYDVAYNKGYDHGVEEGVQVMGMVATSYVSGIECTLNTLNNLGEDS